MNGFSTYFVNVSDKPVRIGPYNFEAAGSETQEVVPDVKSHVVVNNGADAFTFTGVLDGVRGNGNQVECVQGTSTPAVKAQLDKTFGASVLRSTAHTTGVGGNSITLALVDDSAESVSVVSNAVTVHINTGTSTVDTIVALINGDTDAHAKIDASAVNSGSDLVTAFTAENLALGADAAGHALTIEVISTTGHEDADGEYSTILARVTLPCDSSNVPTSTTPATLKTAWDNVGNASVNSLIAFTHDADTDPVAAFSAATLIDGVDSFFRKSGADDVKVAVVFSDLDHLAMRNLQARLASGGIIHLGQIGG